MSIKTNTIERINARYNASSIDQLEKPKKLENRVPNNVHIKVNINPPI